MKSNFLLLNWDKTEVIVVCAKTQIRTLYSINLVFSLGVQSCFGSCIDKTHLCVEYKRKKKQHPARHCVTQLNLWPHCSLLFSAVSLNVKLKPECHFSLVPTTLYTSPWCSCFYLYKKKKSELHLTGSDFLISMAAAPPQQAEQRFANGCHDITSELHRFRVQEFMFSQSVEQIWASGPLYLSFLEIWTSSYYLKERL